ncbi:hypothetical protein HDC92_004954 [Pedobacter sp. AK017]|nr:hypothetical protein [Pedobacter sp. AK017]
MILMLCVSINAGCGKTTPIISAVNIRKPIYVDGVMDVVWQKGSWCKISHLALSKQDTIVTSANISGKFKVRWDRKNCYFFIQVKDDIKCRRPVSEDLYKAKIDFFRWVGENDAVSVVVDSKQEGLTLKHSRINRYTFVYQFDSVLVSYGFKSDINNVKFAQKDTAAGYAMEIAIPWDNLNIDISKRHSFGLQIFIADNDNHQIEPGIPPFSDSIVSWFDTGISLSAASKLPTNVYLND